MEKTVRVNEKCLVRNQKCDRIFEGSKTCFIASPSSDEVALELDIIKQKLKDVNIAPYIAVEEREFQKDIFCEKICSKIIESQFCIVILNDVINEVDTTRKPNANVYYEYGLMTAFRKKIIPIQLEGQSLAFNIQSLDTVKYKQKDFSKQMEEAIKQILFLLDESKYQGIGKSPNIDLILADKGLYKIDKTVLEIYPLETQIAFDRCIKFSNSLEFSMYQKLEGKNLLFIINKENNPLNEIILRSKVLTLNVKNYIKTLSKEIEGKERDKGLQGPIFDLFEFDDPILKTSSFRRILEYYKIKKMIKNSKILVLVDNNEDIKPLKSKYSEACEEIGFKLDLEGLLLDK